MTGCVEELLNEAMELNPEERVDLAGRLLHTHEPVEPGVEESWAREIRKRIDDLDSSAVQPVSAEEARKCIFRLPDAG